MSPEPRRTCVGCRAKRPQSALVRYVAGPGGKPVVGRFAAGRGAWICADTHAACLTRAERSGSLRRALRVDKPT